MAVWKRKGVVFCTNKAGHQENHTNHEMIFFKLHHESNFCKSPVLLDFARSPENFSSVDFFFAFA